MEGGWLKLKVEVANDGTATARNTKVYTALDAGNGLVYDQRWSDPLDLEPHSKGTYTLFLKLPSNVSTRLLVKIISDGFLVDESTSDAVFPPVSTCHLAHSPFSARLKPE